jgi:hypothetical protein
MSEEKPPTGCYVAMGCAGAVIVVIGLMFVALFYFGFVQRGGVYDAMRVQLAQGQLNQLVPYIELYRTQRGAYPDTLEQVAEIIPANTAVMIQDVSFVQIGPNGRLYHYERVGDDHYILRGVGADGAPFTGDDIIPNGFSNGGVGLLLEKPAAAPNSPTPEPAPATVEP